MPVISCYVDDETLRVLRLASEDTGRKVEELAEAAIEGAAIEYKKIRPRVAHDLKYRKAPRCMP
jgi:hypothetical protein